jgi:hypothetical protein
VDKNSLEVDPKHIVLRLDFSSVSVGAAGFFANVCNSNFLPCPQLLSILGVHALTRFLIARPSLCQSHGG